MEIKTGSVVTLNSTYKGKDSYPKLNVIAIKDNTYSCLFWNEGQNKFELIEVPKEAVKICQ